MRSTAPALTPVLEPSATAVEQGASKTWPDPQRCALRGRRPDRDRVDRVQQRGHPDHREAGNV